MSHVTQVTEVPPSVPAVASSSYWALGPTPPLWASLLCPAPTEGSHGAGSGRPTWDK
jgi:hypothetical protein